MITVGIQNAGAAGLRTAKLELLMYAAVVVFMTTAVQLDQTHSVIRAFRPAPKTVTPFTSFDFGDVYTGEAISQIFVIKNEGDAELVIKEFKGG